MKANRGIQKENTRLGIISTIGYFKSQIGDILSDWGIGFFSLTLLYLKSPMCILSPNRDLISQIGDNMPNWEYFLLVLYWSSLVSAFLASFCPKGSLTCIGVYRRNLLTFRNTVSWFVAWRGVVWFSNTTLALTLSSGQTYVPRNGVFWIWNVIDIFCLDVISLTPLFLEIPSKNVLKRITHFYVRMPDTLMPRRPELCDVTKAAVTMVIYVREFSIAGNPHKKVK